ncbi:glycosyltransferase family A protein [Candidatus Margulisiibacteriota bacterium]
MLHIGLLLTKNEGDILQETIESNKKYFDKIYVLDGSNDNSVDILAKYEKEGLCKVWREEKIYPNGAEDHCREFLMHKAQEDYGYEGWFTILCGDEIYHDSPLKIALQAERRKCEFVVWYVMNFFLHEKDYGKKWPEKTSCQDSVRWYCPFGLEGRQFKNMPQLYWTKNGKWTMNMGRSALPNGLKWYKIYPKYGIYKHYNFRSPEQLRKRALDRLKAKHGSAVNYEQFLKMPDKDFYVKKLPGLKVARKFDGSFYEFELENQGSMFKRWLFSGKYVPIQIGNLYKQKVD